MDDIIKLEDFDFDNCLINEKSHENISFYTISNKTLIGAKPLFIRFDKVNRFIRVYDPTRYLVLFGGNINGFIYNRIRYLIGIKGGNTYVISYNYVKINVDSYDSLLLENILILHSVIILIKLVFNENQNHYYHKIILGKGYYQSPENNDNK